ncbi:winged helix-turn-helix domain-containing protein [Streptomyces sp. SID3343]|uniref:winged helix-turn-helix domain-containing protein n=1 Tax=Streptomyces sp. SID3343 TaxID=2690260 RepID=UPI00136CF527|nr:winged helix-turn-helix domain-containing protein [Streptomyces sp. SID3343]MYW05771.1 GntR family transcriptional regulator [Streptomyces sp. SID3343]
MTDRVINRRIAAHPYEQIAAFLISDIESGALAVGERIPSDADLMASYDVARETARRAVAIVRAAGYVETLPQRGSFVRARDQGAEVDSSE